MAIALTTPQIQKGVNMRFLEGEEDSRVLRSDNYDMFILAPLKNRIIRQHHVKDLAKDILKDGQIEPGLVKLNDEGKYVVHAGQHRFLACKELGIPYRYIVQGAMNDKDMTRVHLKHLAFGWKDYLRNHINAGLKEYFRYSNLMSDLSFVYTDGDGKDKKVDIGHDTLLSLLYWKPDGKQVGGQFWDSNVKDVEKNHKLAFNEGLLQFSKEQETFVRRFVKNIDRLAPYITQKYRHAVIRDKLLFVAIQKVWKDKNWRTKPNDPETSFGAFATLITKLQQSANWIERGHAYDDYLDHFEQVLSYGKKRKNRVLFTNV